MAQTVCARVVAVVHAHTAVPTLLRIEDDWNFTFQRIGDKHVLGANGYTDVAAVAYAGVENDRPPRGRTVGFSAEA